MIFCGSLRLSIHSSSGNSFGRLHSWGEAFTAAGRQLLSLLTPPLLQLLAVAAAAVLLLYMALCYQGFHFRVAQVYARLGYPHAQHIVGQRYLQGNLPCQRTFVHGEHKRGSAPRPSGIVFYVLALTLLLCFPLRSWSGEKRGPGHALVQVRCKKKKQLLTRCLALFWETLSGCRRRKKNW